MSAGACSGDHCITCADEGTPMTVLCIDEMRALALCEDEAGIHATVEVALVPPLTPGDRVLVHAAVAIAALGHAGVPA